MTEQSFPITPPPKLVKEWQISLDCPDEINAKANYIATKAARWGADQQLEQDAKWLDTNALYTHNLTVSPSGDALRQAMRRKPPSLKEQALDMLDRVERCTDGDYYTIRCALEQLDD